MRRFLLALVLVASAYAGPDQQTLRAVRQAIAQLRSSDVDTRRLGAQTLARYRAGAKSAVPHLAKALGDEYWGVQHDAAEALKSIGPDGIPGLIKALKSRDPVVRTGICEVLAHEDFLPLLEPHSKKLVLVLKDSDAAVRRAGVALFGAMGEYGIDALLLGLGASKAGARGAAAEALAIAGTQSIPKLCEACKNSRSASVREGICVAFGRMGKKATIAAPTLVLMLQDTNEDVRAEAARSIGRTQASFEAAQEPLFARLGVESAREREGSIDGLAAYGVDAAPGLVECLGSDKAVVRASAAEALFRMGRPAMQPLQEALLDGTRTQRLGAIGLFLRFGARASRGKTLDGVQACLEHEDVDVRRAAAAALGRLGRNEAVEREAGSSTRTVDALIAAVEDADALVRTRALTSLGQLGSAKARGTLEAGLKDKDPRVRMAAHFGLWGLGGEAAAALSGLRAGLADPAARVAAAEALGRMRFVAGAAMPELTGLLQDEAPEARRAAAAALGKIVRPGRDAIVSLRGEWEKKAPAKVRTAIANGLAWLVKNQEEEGFWDADKHGGGAFFDPGVTGLALWAILGAGPADAKAVRRGVDYLMRVQSVDGVLGSRQSHSFQSYHACAAIALAEAWLLTGNPRYVRALEGAVDFIEAARNPGLAWRYQPRGGENDTHVTTWAVTALRLADLGGFVVDPAAYEGAGNWIDKMTDPTFGQVGYNYPGGAPARPEGKQELYAPEKSQAMTAAGAWCRYLLGGARLKSSAHRGSIKLCLEIPPQWARAHRDLYYFHFGSLAVFQHGGAAWKKWSSALSKTLLKAQDSDGSWPATGVWGEDGGRVYATALGVLSLLVPYRYPPEFALASSASQNERAAIGALSRASRDADPSVRAAAETALRSIEPPG